MDIYQLKTFIAGEREATRAKAPVLLAATSILRRA